MISAPDICRVLCTALFAALVSMATSVAGAQPEDVRIVVYQSYDFRDSSRGTYQIIDNFDLPVLDIVEDMIFAMGGNVVDAGDDETHLAEIRVSINGRALGMRYTEWENQYYYTGVRLYGSVTLVAKSSGYYYRTFSSLTPAPFSVGDFDPGYDQPYHAPFLATLNEFDGLIRALADVMAEAWGIKAIIPMTDDADVTARADVVNLLGDFGDPVVVPDLIDVLETDYSYIVRWQAAWALGRIGDQRAVSHLIDSLTDEARDVRWFAAWSLREITGQTFGPDHAAWAGWWAEQGNQTGG